MKDWKNWWYYHKWYVICGVVILGIFINILGRKLEWWEKSPDFQIAYIGSAPLPEDTARAVEQAFAALNNTAAGRTDTRVRLNQYLDGISEQDADTSYYEYAAEIALIGDISNCDSYFFLMEDPDKVQREYHLLAASDGSCPADADYVTSDKVTAWKDSPFAKMDLGNYSTIISGEKITGSNQELLHDMYIGRRCFYTKDTVKNPDACSRLWDAISLF